MQCDLHVTELLNPLRIKSMGVSCTLRSKTRSPALIRPPTRIRRRLWHLRRRAPISTSSLHHHDAPHTSDTTPWA